MLISLLIYLIHLIRGFFSLFLAHLSQSFLLSTFKKYHYFKHLWHAKLYYVNTKKYLIFDAHIISRVETIITIFCLQFEGKIN
jgi:hypothetical protein